MEKKTSDPLKKMKITLVSPKRLHLDKNYYRHMIDPFVPCNFGYTNLPLGLIDSKIFKVLIVIAPPCIEEYDNYSPFVVRILIIIR